MKEKIHNIEKITGRKIQDILNDVVFYDQFIYYNTEKEKLERIYIKEVDEEENEELMFPRCETVYIIGFEGLKDDEFYVVGVACREYLHYLDGSLCVDEITTNEKGFQYWPTY